MNLENDVGLFIKENRISSGFKSQRQLAEKSGVSAATISRIESGIQKPNVDTLKTLSGYLKTTTLFDLMVVAGYWDEGDNTGKLISSVYTKEHEAFEKLIDMLKVIVDDEGKFPSEYHEDIFNIFGGYAETGHLINPSDATAFDREYLDYLNLNKDELTIEDSEKAIKEFNKFYNYTTVKHGIKNLDENFIIVNKTVEDFLEELNHFFVKHDLNKKLPSTNAAEKEFINKLELTDSNLLKEFELTLDGEKLSEEEARGVIAYLRSLRQFDE